ncbi:concanavalin A-like lectin/glucanase domain-containing protein [Chlamydoabsidia padenii]|nr:concanavalin A-like lectin/glucanase domain-containing protein [Chlamydoabsidia padenii]
MMDLKQDKNYMVMDYKLQRPGSDYKRIFSKNNINLTTQSAQLIVRSMDGEMTSAAFGTQRNDFLYGTFRSFIKTPSAPGTVASFYYYWNDTAEIDMETLGRYTDPRQTYFAIQPQIRNEDGSASELTHAKYPLTYDPTMDFYEYRFDWLPDSVDFYLDGHLASTMNTNIPSSPGRIILNHWTDGNPHFSGQAPMDQDIIMEVANLTFFFNSTKDTSGPTCKLNQSPCDVKDITSRKLLPFDNSSPTSSSSSSRGSLVFTFIPTIPLLLITSTFLLS